MSAEQKRLKIWIAALAAVVITVLLVSAILTHSVLPAAKIGAFYLADGLAAGAMLALVTHLRKPLPIYACLAGFVATFPPLFNRLPLIWFVSDAAWNALPQSSVTFLGVLPTVSYLTGLILVFALAGFHSADPIAISQVQD
jgi:peptidoglycan/LPS O-acetylase OafA/YrhL